MDKTKFEYKTYRLTSSDVKFFWKHMRPEDKLECHMMGTTIEAFNERIKDPNNTSFCFRVKGKRIACGGYGPAGSVHPGVPSLLVFWFYCTPQFKKHTFMATKAAKMFVENISTELKWSTYRKVVRVWSGHTKALRWVRMLGFKKLIAIMPVGNGESSIYILRLGEGMPVKEAINDKYQRNQTILEAA